MGTTTFSPGASPAGTCIYRPLSLPELLAKPDPYDPSIDDSIKLFDAALFNKHYYLYHGAGPAVLLFLPWRLITGHDLPENYAAFLFCYFGFLFSSAALLALLRLAGNDPGPAVTESFSSRWDSARECLFC